MQDLADKWRRDELRIGLVPTMGFLHAGHLSLVRIARRQTDRVVVSIFVNPAQFAPGEDFETYPRDHERDLGLLAEEGADIVFLPDASEIYPTGFQTRVTLEHLPQHLCGLSRPVFFSGVATVVTKLFHIVKPHLAVFGEKDYQQLLVIRRMVADMNLDVRIEAGPIVREEDGLAMSSRNAYLSNEERPAALSLYKALRQASRQVAEGERRSAMVLGKARELIESMPGTCIDYINICDPQSLEDVATIDRPARMALAVKVGRTRLIDNLLLVPPGGTDPKEGVAV